jgi:predicted nucleic acid-binding protein
MPDPRVVCNTSPLLYLHQVGHLELLGHLYGHLWTTPGVVDELAVGATRGHDVPLVAEVPWVTIERPAAEASRVPALGDLGRGEAEVIALATEWPNSLVILDEQAGRRVAASLGLRITGILGVLLRAKKEGYLDRVTPVLARLRETSMWLSDSVIQMVCEEAGE